MECEPLKVTLWSNADRVALSARKKNDLFLSFLQMREKSKSFRTVCVRLTPSELCSRAFCGILCRQSVAWKQFEALILRGLRFHRFCRRMHAPKPRIVKRIMTVWPVILELLVVVALLLSLETASGLPKGEIRDSAITFPYPSIQFPCPAGGFT